MATTRLSLLVHPQLPAHAPSPQSPRPEWRGGKGLAITAGLDSQQATAEIRQKLQGLRAAGKSPKCYIITSPCADHVIHDHHHHHHHPGPRPSAGHGRIRRSCGCRWWSGSPSPAVADRADLARGVGHAGRSDDRATAIPQSDAGLRPPSGRASSRRRGRDRRADGGGRAERRRQVDAVQGHGRRHQAARRPDRARRAVGRRTSPICRRSPRSTAASRSTSTTWWRWGCGAAKACSAASAPRTATPSRARSRRSA